MGQHIASTMAQIICEELGANWKDMRVQLASNDPKFNDPVLGAQITGGSWSTMMNFDAMSRAGAAGRMALTEAAAAAMGVPAGELVVREFRDLASEVEEVDDASPRSSRAARPPRPSRRTSSRRSS